MEVEKPLTLTKEDISASFKEWKKEHKLIALKRSIALKRKKSRKKNRSRKGNKSEGEIEQPVNIQALPEEFINNLTSADTSKEISKTTEPENLKISFKKKKRKLKLTNSLVDSADYIPLDVNSKATDFKIARLDKNISNSMAESAMKFYNRKRNHKCIERAPTITLFRGAEKIKAKQSLEFKKVV